MSGIYIWLNISKGTSWVRWSKLTFLLFHKWLFFQLNFHAKSFEISHCILEIWRFCWGCHNRLVESWFWEKDFNKFGNLYKVLVFGQFRGLFSHENTVFVPNSSSNLKIKYWRFQNKWNLKIDFGTILWDILTLHPHNSKFSLPPTGTFRYVSSRTCCIACCNIKDLLTILSSLNHYLEKFGKYYKDNLWFDSTILGKIHIVLIRASRLKAI